MFWLHTLLVDVLKKVRSLINWIIIGREKEDYYAQKDTLFDILSLVNQFNRSKSTYSKGSKDVKIYYLENHIPNLIKQR